MQYPAEFRQGALSMLIGQLVVLILLLALSLLICPTKRVFGAVFAGGITAILPYWQAYRWAFRYWGARAAHKIVGAFYFGQALKYVLTAGLFFIWFALNLVDPKWLLGSYCALLLVQRIVPLLCMVRGQQCSV